MDNFRVYRHIGTQLQKRRKELGLSLSAAANILNMNVDELMAYEYGTKEMYSDVLLRLSRELNTDIDYYFRGFE